MSQLTAHNLAMSNFYGTQRGVMQESKRQEDYDRTPLIQYVSMIVGLLSLFTIIALNVTNIIYLTGSGGTMESIKNSQASLSGSMKETSGLLIEDIKPKTDLINSMVSYNIPAQLSLLHSLIKNDVLKQCTPSFMFNNTICPIVENPAHSHYFEEVNLEGFSGCHGPQSKPIVNSNISFIEYPSFIPGSTKPGSCIRFPSFSLSSTIFAYTHTIMGHGCSELDVGDHYFSIGRIADHGHDQPVFETLTEWFVNDKINRRTCTVAAAKVGAWMACIIMTDSFYDDMMSNEHGKITISYLDIYGRKKEWMYSRSEVRYDYPFASLYFSIGSGAVIDDTVYFLVWGGLMYSIEQNAYCNAPGCAHWTQQMCNQAQRPTLLGNRQILNGLLSFKTNTDGKPILTLRTFMPGTVPIGSEGRLIYFETTQMLYIYLRSTTWHSLPMTGAVAFGPPLTIAWFEQTAVSRPGAAPCGASNRCPKSCITGVYTDLFPLGTNFQYSMTAYLDSETRRMNPVLALISRNETIYVKTLTNSTQRAEYTTTTCFTFKLRIWCLSIVELAPSTITSFEPVPFLYQLDVGCHNSQTNLTSPLMDGTQPYMLGPYQSPRSECYFERLNDEIFFVISLPSAIQAYAIRENQAERARHSALYADDVCPLAIAAYNNLKPNARRITSLVIGDWQFRPVTIQGGTRIPLSTYNSDYVPPEMISPEDPGHVPFPGGLYTGDPCNKNGRHCVCYDENWNEIYTPGPDDFLYPPTTKQTKVVTEPVSMENNINYNVTQGGVNKTPGSSTTSSIPTRTPSTTKDQDLNGTREMNTNGTAHDTDISTPKPPSESKTTAGSTTPHINSEEASTTQSTLPSNKTDPQTQTTTTTRETTTTKPGHNDTRSTTQELPQQITTTVMTTTQHGRTHERSSSTTTARAPRILTSSQPDKPTTTKSEYTKQPPNREDKATTSSRLTTAVPRTQATQPSATKPSTTVASTSTTRQTTKSSTENRTTPKGTNTTQLPTTPTTTLRSTTPTTTRRSPATATPINATTTTERFANKTIETGIQEQPNQNGSRNITETKNDTNSVTPESGLDNNKSDKTDSSKTNSNTTYPVSTENEQFQNISNPNNSGAQSDKTNNSPNTPSNSSQDPHAPGQSESPRDLNTTGKCPKSNTNETTTKVIQSHESRGEAKGPENPQTNMTNVGDQSVKPAATDSRRSNTLPQEKKKGPTGTEGILPPVITLGGPDVQKKSVGSFIKVEKTTIPPDELKPPETINLDLNQTGSYFTYDYKCPKDINSFHCDVIWNHKYKLSEVCNGTVTILATMTQLDLIYSDAFTSKSKTPIVPQNYYLCFSDDGYGIYQAPFMRYSRPSLRRIVEAGPWHKTKILFIATAKNMDKARLPFSKKDFVTWSWDQFSGNHHPTCLVSELCGYPLVLYKHDESILGFYVSFKYSTDMESMPKRVPALAICEKLNTCMEGKIDSRGLEVNVTYNNKTILLQSLDEDSFVTLSSNGGRCVNYSMRGRYYQGFVEKIVIVNETVVESSNKVKSSDTPGGISSYFNIKDLHIEGWYSIMRRYWGN
ncbi:attachment glycoprotein [Wufeng Apodemus chevrieri jeilongvirus 1]|uniref:Attachment glycoprotein n=1 Tax=Wufeng Apodemus chevrieri jeilongvirus 1 TaxID=2928987 RepID=A0A8T9KQ84_9MONO|nr:attachment glycoprotein [Wufeng Apodemus chevrieri jeilongvirus 1]